VATLLGARILEKHFTHDKTLPGNDHYHAMDKTDIRRFRQRIASLNTLLGDRTKQPLQTESLARQNARRSLVLLRDIPAGHALSAADLTWKRPGSGISPSHWDDVIGRKTGRILQADDILKWQDIL
jgi:N-acetylneuraminate synthase